LKSWLNKRARIRGFFETHYENTKNGTDPGQREEDLRKARANTRTQRKRAKHARRAEANHSLEKPTPLKEKSRLNHDACQHEKPKFDIQKPQCLFVDHYLIQLGDRRICKILLL